MVTLAQLRELGLSRHQIEARIEARRLRRLHRGVYAVGHEALTSKSRFIAAVFACGPGALASHRVAGVLQGLVQSTTVMDVTVPRGCKPKPDITIHRSRFVHPDDRAVVDGIPVTSVARTIVDLADVLNDRQTEGVVRRAEILKAFDLKSVEATQARLLGRKGGHRLKRVLAAYQPEPRLLRSPAERRVEGLCRRHGLPMPQFNVQLHGYEVDVYWPGAGLVLEFDGAQTHATRHAFHEDRRRDRALAVEGIQTVRVTWPDLDGRLVEQVREILRHR